MIYIIKTLWFREKTKFYIWNELHSIEAVRCKYSSISRRLLTGGMKKNISFCRKRSANIIPQNKHWQSWRILWNKRLEEISFDLLLVSFVYYTHNSLGKWAENIRILLNCQSEIFASKCVKNIQWEVVKSFCLCSLFYKICLLCCGNQGQLGR